MRHIAVVCGVIFWAGLSLGQVDHLPAGLKLSPEFLLEFEDEPGHFLFLGKTPQQQTYILDIQNGKLRELRMIDFQPRRSGEGFRWDLEGDLRLFIPADQKKSGAHGGEGAYFLARDRARENLLKRPLDEAKLIDLGLGPLLAVNTTEAPGKPVVSQTNWRFLPESGQLVLLSLPENVPHDVERIFRSEIDHLVAASDLCFLMDPRLFSRKEDGQFILFCKKEADVDRFFASLAAPGVARILRIQNVSDLESLQNIASVEEAMQLLTITSGPLPVRLLAVRFLLLHAEEWLFQSESVEFAKSFYGFHRVLTDIESLSESLYSNLIFDSEEVLRSRHSGKSDLSREQLRKETRERVEGLTAFRDLILPLRLLNSGILEAVQKLDRDEAHRLVFLHASVGDGSVLPLLLKDGMMESWLKSWRQNLELGATLPEFYSWQELGPWDMRQRRGRLYENIHLSGVLVDPWPWSEARGYGLFSVHHLLRQPHPSLQLGVPGLDKEARKKILQFLIQSEPVVQQITSRVKNNELFNDFLRSLNGIPSEALPILRNFWVKGTLDERDYSQLSFLVPLFERVGRDRTLQTLAEIQNSARPRYTATGSDLISRFIYELTFVHPLSIKVAGFDQGLYDRNLLGIFTELLEDSEYVLKNEGTYLTILDASVGLLRGFTQSSRFQAREGDEALAQAIRRLEKVIQTKLLSALPWVQNVDRFASACEVLLSPSPAKSAQDYLKKATLK